MKDLHDIDNLQIGEVEKLGRIYNVTNIKKESQVKVKVCYELRNPNGSVRVSYKSTFTHKMYFGELLWIESDKVVL